MNNQPSSVIIEKFKKDYKYIDIVTVFFVTTLLASNLLSSAKIVDLHFSLFSVPLIFDGGLIVFPFCYIFGDILTEVYGFQRSRRVIWLGFFGMLLICFLMFQVKTMPGESGWLERGGQASFNFTLFGLFSGVLVTASLAAYLVGEFVNSIVLAKLKVFQAGKKMWLRFIISTIFGQLFDTLIFVTIATLGGLFESQLFLSLFLTNYIFKILIEFVMLPFSTRLTVGLKKMEHEDYFDRHTKFNPFKF